MFGLNWAFRKISARATLRDVSGIIDNTGATRTADDLFGHARRNVNIGYGLWAENIRRLAGYRVVRQGDLAVGRRIHARKFLRKRGVDATRRNPELEHVAQLVERMNGTDGLVLDLQPRRRGLDFVIVSMDEEAGNVKRLLARHDDGQARRSQ